MSNNKISSKELISKIKDYVDCSDAAYSFLNYVFENEKDGWFDKFKENTTLTLKIINL